jgi:putative Mn2+ efflux pump MntP
MSGADSALRVRIALSFGLFEAGMPIIGLVGGRQVAHALASHAELVGGALLVVTGAYTAVQASKDTHAAPSAMSVGLSLIGLELGQQLGVRVEHNSELFSGIVVMAVGVAIAAGLF